MAIEEGKRPKWHNKFCSLVESCWQSHGPSAHITFKWAYDDESKTWMILAAPVFQEVLGGEDDGKKVWTGFVFHSDKFQAEEGVYLSHFAAGSVCNECSPVPRMMLVGKFFGRNFYLQVYLEPVPESPVIEIIDTINQKILHKEQDDDDAGASPQPAEGGDEGQEPGERHPPGLPGETSAD